MIQNIAYYPSPILRNGTQIVTEITPDIRRLVSNMHDTMRSFDPPALGIAAPQIGRVERIFIVDGGLLKGWDPRKPLVFINPEILSAKGGDITIKEGCLSFPNVFLNIRRPRMTHVQAVDLEGQPFEIEASGFLARVIQHEQDHLDGRLMIDLVSHSLRDMAHKEVRSWREKQGKTLGF